MDVSSSSLEEEWQKLSRHRSFAVVGLGGAGSDALHDMVRLGLPPEVQVIAINTDARHLSRLVDIEKKILLGFRRLRGEGSGGDRELVRAEADDLRDELISRMADFEFVFLLAGLGGGTGSALLPYLAQELRTPRTLPVPVAFLPFHAEMDTNSSRRENTREALRELEVLGGLLLLLSNEKLRRFEALPMNRVLSVRNTYLHRLVVGLVDMIEHPSQINVDMASLKRHLEDSGLSTLVMGEEHISEPERLVHQALTDSLLDFELQPSSSALVHVEGGANLTLRTVERIWQTMRHHLGQPERMLVGTRTHPEPRDTIRLTAVVGGLHSNTIRKAMGTAK